MEDTQIAEWQKVSDLGSGAFGVVTLWKNKNTEDFIAIKKCKFKTNTTLSSKQRERWNNEVQIMKIINHPNVIKYKPIAPELETGLLKNNPTKLPLLPMEYCRKGNLRHVLCKPKNMCGLHEGEVRHILEDISSGLQHLHNLKITHRDIKPDNIVLQHCDIREGGTVYKIIDLGYAKELSDTVISFVGTLHYLAPEIFQMHQYNNSVDYWSMGILTFEIICGILPFLPHLPPLERFELIKDKDPDDICIFRSYSGRINYSTEIKKEHYISNCLKQNIEIWLRHVLEFDQQKRSESFPNEIKVFDYLHNILKKKIITVFSVHKLEYYSYEINECTLLSTLKDWISRDTKIPKTDLVVLCYNNTSCWEDSSLVCEMLKNDDKIFVIKKGAVVTEPSYIFPKLVKELFKSASKFDMTYVKPLYGQAIFYITFEKRIVEAFKQSLTLYILHIKTLIEVVAKNSNEPLKDLLKLLTKIECYNSIRKKNTCDLDLSENQNYKDCLNYCLRLLTSLERSIANLKGLRKKIRIISKRQKILYSYLPSVLKDYDLDEQYNAILTLLERSGGKENSGQLVCVQFVVEIKKVVSETIKIKDKLFRNEKLNSFISAMANVLNSAELLNSWIKDFQGHMLSLTVAFEQSEIVYRDILLKAAEDKNKKKSKVAENLNGELLNLPPSYLIRENQSLRCMFEEILSKSILAHKTYTETMKPYFLS